MFSNDKSLCFLVFVGKKFIVTTGDVHFCRPETFCYRGPWPEDRSSRAPPPVTKLSHIGSKLTFCKKNEWCCFLADFFANSSTNFNSAKFRQMFSDFFKAWLLQRCATAVSLLRELQVHLQGCFILPWGVCSGVVGEVLGR